MSSGGSPSTILVVGRRLRELAHDEPPAREVAGTADGRAGSP